MHRARFVPNEVGTGHGRRALVLLSRFPLWVAAFVARFVRTSALRLIPAGASCTAYVTVWWRPKERWFVADGQDVNAEGVNAYKRVPLCPNYGEAFLNPLVSVDSLE